MSDPDLQPGIDDVLQEEGGGGLSVPVCITDQKTPVRTQALPAKGGATFTKTITTTALQVLRADHRRRRATLICTTASGVFLYAFSRASAQDESSMSVWPANVPLEVDATTDVFLRVPATPGTSVTVGVSTSLWAEGE